MSPNRLALFWELGMCWQEMGFLLELRQCWQGKKTTNIPIYILITRGLRDSQFYSFFLFFYFQRQVR